VSGGPTATTTIEEMIASTGRGILVTHCGMMRIDDHKLLTLSAVTQDGLFLIEHGKISHPIKNMWINESPMFIFNKILQIGSTIVTKGVQSYVGDGSVMRDLPARAVCDGTVLLACPPIKVQDFNFTRLTDAI
jgi:predicted Zn-dependent protease